MQSDGGDGAPGTVPGGDGSDGGPPSSSPLDNVPEPAQDAISTAKNVTDTVFNYVGDAPSKIGNALSDLLGGGGGKEAASETSVIGVDGLDVALDAALVLV